MFAKHTELQLESIANALISVLQGIDLHVNSNAVIPAIQGVHPSINVNHASDSSLAVVFYQPLIITSFVNAKSFGLYAHESMIPSSLNQISLAQAIQ